MVRWVSISIIAAAVIISGTIIYVNKNSAPANENNNQNSKTVKVSVDDDAVLGDKNAPVTIIEFSDYECPFCKRHAEEVYPDIKKDYIDTGKVKLVFRDYVAVKGHNPLATSEALAAECSREQGGDSMYYKYHDALFAKTTSNGNGMPLSALGTIAKGLGLNVTAFQSCLDSKKYLEEFNKDNADATRAGVSGTPSFFIGKSTADGVIDGTLIVGAQPYASFQAAIDELLSK